MNLTPHFTLDELTRSEIAVRHAINNEPHDEELDNLYTLAAGLERVRSVLGCPIHVTSGYRSPKLNSTLRGAKNSAHMRGLAADFVAPEYGNPCEVSKTLAHMQSVVGFNRLIFEGRWVHIDFPEPGETPAGQVLTAVFGRDGVTYVPGVM